MQGSPTKGGARKKNQSTMGGACDNDDSSDDSSDNSSHSLGSDDDVNARTSAALAVLLWLICLAQIIHTFFEIQHLI